MRVLPLPLLLFLLYLTVCVKFANPLNCHETIVSSTSKSGQVTSPNFPNPYPDDAVCHFRFIGTGKERVQIAFTKVDLDYPQGDPANPQDCQDVDSLSVSVQTREGNREIGLYCGSKRPPTLMSPGSYLDLTLTTRRPPHSTHHHTSQGFQANYSFVTDYGIKSGKQNDSLDCVFNYRSSTQGEGVFTSPNFPGLYPSNTTCHYLFLAAADERVQIQFLYFDVEGLPPRCSRETESDFVEFSNFNIDLTDRKMVHVCGSGLDGRQKVIQSDGNFFRVTFKSNEIYESVGFKAVYKFVQFEDPAEVKKMARSGSCSSIVSKSLNRVVLVPMAAAAAAAAGVVVVSLRRNIWEPS